MLLLAPVSQPHAIDKRGRIPPLVRSAHAVIDAAIGEHKLAGVWALFSGGHDSLVTTHVASQHPAFQGVIHIDTCTGILETEQFVRDTCARYGWRLIVKQPVTRYEQLIVRYGFPGPAQHNMMYRYLKERPLVQAKQEAVTVTGGRIGFVTGVRSQESARRMGHVEMLRKDKMGIWAAIVHNWSALDLGVYMRLNALPVNPVKQDTHMSGECLCAAYAKRDEDKMLGMFYPLAYERIQRWEALVLHARDLQIWEAENGYRDWSTVITETRARWGWKDAVPSGQLELLPMCMTCSVAQQGANASQDAAR